MLMVGEGKEKGFSKTFQNLCLQKLQVSLGTIKFKCIKTWIMLYCLVCTNFIKGRELERSKWAQRRINGKHKASEAKRTFHCLLKFSFLNIFFFYIEVVYHLYFQVSTFICEASGAICSG